MKLTISLLDDLTTQAKASPRLRMNLDLRTSPSDGSQRMLNALMPGTKVPVHRHRLTDETVICLKGKIDEIIFEETTDADVDVMLRAIPEVVAYLRNMSPVWKELQSGRRQFVL